MSTLQHCAVCGDPGLDPYENKPASVSDLLEYDDWHEHRDNLICSCCWLDYVIGRCEEPANYDDTCEQCGAGTWSAFSEMHSEDGAPVCFSCWHNG